jgi:hypothetical protein
MMLVRLVAFCSLVAGQTTEFDDPALDCTNENICSKNCISNWMCPGTLDPHRCGIWQTPQKDVKVWNQCQEGFQGSRKFWECTCFWGDEQMENCDELVDRCFIMTGVREKCQTFKAECIANVAVDLQQPLPACLFAVILVTSILLADGCHPQV